jgi:nicotinamidase-related amidase
MIEIEGKQVFTELEELVDPRHTALIVVDMQRDFCIPGGAFDELGIDISMYPPMVPRLVRLVEGARAAGVPILYIQMTQLPNRAIESPAQIRFNLRMHLANLSDGGPDDHRRAHARARRPDRQEVPVERLLGHEPRHAAPLQRDPVGRHDRLHDGRVRRVDRA